MPASRDQADQTRRVPLPPEETGPVPVSLARAEPRWFGVPPPLLLLGLAVLAFALAVVLVAAPFLREPAPADDRLVAPDASQRRRLALAEERDRALSALKELEFDHRTGKVSDEDYRALVGPLRRRAAELLRALEPAKSRQERVRAGRG